MSTERKPPTAPTRPQMSSQPAGQQQAGAGLAPGNAIVMLWRYDVEGPVRLVATESSAQDALASFAAFQKLTGEARVGALGTIVLESPLQPDGTRTRVEFGMQCLAGMAVQRHTGIKPANALN